MAGPWVARLAERRAASSAGLKVENLAVEKVVMMAASMVRMSAALMAAMMAGY